MGYVFPPGKLKLHLLMSPRPTEAMLEEEHFISHPRSESVDECIACAAFVFDSS